MPNSQVEALMLMDEVSNSDSLFILPDEIQELLRKIHQKETIEFSRKICA